MAIDQTTMDAVSTTSLLTIYNHCGYTNAGLSDGKALSRLLRYENLNPAFRDSIYNAKSLRSFMGYSHFYNVMPEGFTQNGKGYPEDENRRKYIGDREIVEATAFSYKTASWQGGRFGWEKYNMYPESWKSNFGGTSSQNILYGDNSGSEKWIEVTFDSSCGEEIKIKPNNGTVRYAFVLITHQSPGHRGTNVSYRTYAYYIKQFSYPGATPGGGASGSDPAYENEADKIPPSQQVLYRDNYWYSESNPSQSITNSYNSPYVLYNEGTPNGSPKTFYFGGRDQNLTFAPYASLQYDGGNDDAYGNPVILCEGQRQTPTWASGSSLQNNAVYKLKVWVPVSVTISGGSGTSRIFAMKASNGQIIHFRWTKP